MILRRTLVDVELRRGTILHIISSNLVLCAFDDCLKMPAVPRRQYDFRASGAQHLHEFDVFSVQTRHCVFVDGI